MADALKYLCKNDAVLASFIKACPKPNFKKHTNYYQELVSSIISQQLSIKAAATIEGRFEVLFDGIFPTPKQILEKNIEELRSVGLSRPKVGYIQDLARNIIDGSIDFEALDGLSNHEIVSELTKVKGIGEWTVHMFLMSCMGRLNVLPTGDLGIKNGVTKLYGFEQTATADQVTEIAARHNWHPYESIASWYIWQSLDNAPK